MVACEVCGWWWDERDPGVRYLYIDRAWTCADESECFGRRAALSLELDYAKAMERTARNGLG